MAAKLVAFIEKKVKERQQVDRIFKHANLSYTHFQRFYTIRFNNILQRIKP